MFVVSCLVCVQSTAVLRRRSMTWGNRWWPAASAPARRRSAPHRNAHSTSGNTKPHLHRVSDCLWAFRSYLRCLLFHCECVWVCVRNAQSRVITSGITNRLSGRCWATLLHRSSCFPLSSRDDFIPPPFIKTLTTWFKILIRHWVTAPDKSHWALWRSIAGG